LPPVFRQAVRACVSQSQPQVPVDCFQYLHKVGSPVAVQPFKLPHEEKAVPAVTVVAEVFHLVHTAVAVEVDVAGRFPVLIQRVKEIPTYAPVTGQIVLENGQPVICPF